MGNSSSHIASLPQVVDRQVHGTQNSPAQPMHSVAITSATPASGSKRKAEHGLDAPPQKRLAIQLSSYSVKDDNRATTGRPLRRLLTISMTNIRGSLKRKATHVEDVAHDPQPTKRSLPSLFAGAPAKHSPITFIFNLPTEMIMAITACLSGRDLLHASQVCHRLASIAGPMFMTECGLVLPPDENKLLVLRGRAYDALMVWSRVVSTSFKRYYCSFAYDDSEARRQMRQLQRFWDQPMVMECESVHFSYYNLDSVPSQFLDLLLVLSRKGCTRLECHGLSTVTPCLSGFRNTAVQRNAHSRLHSFRPSSPLFFTPPFIDYTIDALTNAHLRELGLFHTDLSPIQWAVLLPYALLPHLDTLEIESSCRITTLLKFLQRHPTVNHISIHVPKFSASSRSAGRRDLSNINLTDLSTLSGPSYYVNSLLQRLCHPPALSVLTLSFCEFSPPYRLMTDIIRSVTMCHSVFSLYVDLPPRGLHASHFSLLGDELVMPHIKHLSIDVPTRCCVVSNTGVCSDDVLVYLVAWLHLFPNLKSLSLEEPGNKDRTGFVSTVRTIQPTTAQLTIVSGSVTLTDVLVI
ncbi:hypothetical protein BJ138DRAFT_1119184 [Hygrophoropsis aurantiaca]|uniref:Uncharacterized protein n=1 Tax=Hygrophoropsis aurantiaca TaxID=72124 RepID=A0ACB7ZUE6_9AGAM|nr:hypothetical protein BJ138DRAFT_1119184 [Hygrophoropsis aurantiaca]